MDDLMIESLAVVGLAVAFGSGLAVATRAFCKLGMWWPLPIMAGLALAASMFLMHQWNTRPHLPQRTAFAATLPAPPNPIG